MGLKHRVAKQNAFYFSIGMFCLFLNPSITLAVSACPKPMEEPEKVNCDISNSACQKCQGAVDEQRSRVQEFKNKQEACMVKEYQCGGGMQAPAPLSKAMDSSPAMEWLGWFSRAICQEAVAALSAGQDAQLGDAQKAAGKGAACYAAVKAEATAAEIPARKCYDEIKKACSGEPSGMKEADKCKKAANDAKKKAEEAGKKQKDAAANEKKNGDNKKKEESAGGMPPMPQIPQMPQKDEKPPEAAEYPTTDSTVASSTAPEIETSKFDDGKSDIAPPSVGFGDSKSTNTDTGIGPNHTFPTGNFGSDSAFRTPSANGLGEQGAGSSVAAAVPPGGGGGSAGAGNSSGASRPGDGTAAGKAADAANPYEVSVGSGGRLGVPKGKSSGDADAPIDAVAAASFNGDFKADAGGILGDQAAGEEEEIGYTIFKMVKYRYSELKKRGNI